MSLIRTWTYLKYAGLQIKEAEAALEQGDDKRCIQKIYDSHTALIKAVAAALPMVRKDFFKMTEKELIRNISDLTNEETTAIQIVNHISKINSAGMPDATKPVNAGKVLSAASQAFTLLNDIFPNR